MALSDIERMSALILARNIARKRDILTLNGDIAAEVLRLAEYRIFSVSELADISGLSSYSVRNAVPPEVILKARGCIKPFMLDTLVRCVGAPAFTKLHLSRLIEQGATIAGIARVSGLNERSLRRWAERES